MDDRHFASTDRPWQVGLIGAGLVAQTIHLPVLAGLADRFALRAIWDIDPEAASSASSLTGARAAADIEDLLADPALDVVAVCTPAAFHAEHAIAALRSAAKVVLIEKPLCATLEEADAILSACRETAKPIFVGTMHLFDPAWRFVAERLGSPPHMIRSATILPPNASFENWASEGLCRRGSPGAAPDPGALARISIMELAIHDLPLIRRLLSPGSRPRVHAFHGLAPFGFSVTIEAGETLVDLFGILHAHWRPEWTLEAVADDWDARIEFTPSFVPAGSGTARVSQAGRSWVHNPVSVNGYGAEWAAIAAFLDGELAPPDPEMFVDDLRFALDIADQGCALLASEAGR